MCKNTSYLRRMTLLLLWLGAEFVVQIKAQPSDISKNKLDEIFYLGNGTGVVIFNDTSSPPFKVQRSPDGKLSVVFNDFLIFQKTTETPAATYPSDTNVHTERNYYPIAQSDGIVCKERQEGKSYCQDVPNYAQQAQLNKIRPEQLEQFKHYFNEDLIQPQNITQRMNFSPTEQEFCVSKTTLLNPKGAETKDAKWMLILQDENHQQRISVELCEKESGQCNLPFELSLHYHAKCKQYYVYRTMVVVTDGVLREESVKLPNCCKCVWWQSTL